MSEARPDDWQYIQGLLFVVVLGFMPGGFAGLLRSRYQALVAAVTRRTKAHRHEPAFAAVPDLRGDA